MGTVYVNRTGSNINVYEATDFKTLIGTLYPNELFSLVRLDDSVGQGYCTIRFRNKYHLPATGIISAGRNDVNIAEANKLCKYAQFKKVINGITYYGFQMRRDEAVYNGGGAYVKQAVKGIKFLCKDSSTGDTHPDWKRFQYLETGVGTGVYTRVEGGENAYIDIGYNAGSTMTSNSSFIGSL